MGILADTEIHRLATELRMIEPFVPHKVRDGVISYGLGSYNYDLRAGRKWSVPRQHPRERLVLDPKRADPRCWRTFECDSFELEPDEFALGETVEAFCIPRDVLVQIIGKSSYARVGVFPIVTLGEPEWRGTWTIEIKNMTPLPVRIYSGEGIASAVFHRAESECALSYNDLGGKFQDQNGLTLSFV